MDLRLCRQCSFAKDADEFYVSNPTQCKVCVRKAVAARRSANIESARAYDRERATLPHRRAANARVSAEWREANRQRYQANTKLNNAVRDGKVVPWPVCALHDCATKPVAHHPDYSRPLDVVWLCQAHHKQAHALAEAA